MQACRIVAALLDGRISASDLEIVASDVQVFKENVVQIARLLSAEIHEQAEALSYMTLAAINNNNGGAAESKQVATTSLAKAAPALQAQVSAASNSIAQIKANIQNLVKEISATHRDVLETQIRILEQTMHGSVVRGTKAHAEHLSVVAEGLEMKIQSV